MIKLGTSEPRAEIQTRKGNDSMEQAMDFANALNKMEKWLSYPNMEPKLRRDLAALEERLVKDSGDKETKEEILDRFYKDLDFGTGGIRGILGAGTNRMNIFTVRRVTQGFADYLNRRYDGTGKRPSVAIAYDSRTHPSGLRWKQAVFWPAMALKFTYIRRSCPRRLCLLPYAITAAPAES